MATKTDSGFTSSDAQYAQQYSAEVLNEGIVKCPVAMAMMEYGAINKEDALSKADGGTVTLYNRPRVDSNGINGDADFYSNAERQETNTRTIDISKLSYSFKYKVRGSQDEQYTSFRLEDGVLENAADWMRGTFSAALINQAAGNNASSINQPSVASNAFTGSTLVNITGQNSVTAPTYWYEGGNGGAITTAAGIVSGNTLSIQDFEVAAKVIGQNVAGRPTFQTFVGKDCMALAFISRTGLFQLTREATTLGQGPQLTEQIYAQLAGGEKIGDLETFKIPGIPFKFIVVEDHWMPRGVTTSGTAETANTRRAVIVGKNAVDLTFGRGFTMPAGASGRGVSSGIAGTGTVPGVNIEIDPDYKRLNKETYGNISLLYGAKKVTVTGSGANASNSYDLASYVIDHYSDS